MVPEHNIEHRPPGSIRQRPSWTAFGVSPAMFRGDGNAQRESRRAMFLDSILPVSAIIAGELSEKLETPVTISHNESGVCRLPTPW